MFRKGFQQAAVLTMSAMLLVSASAFAAGSHPGPKPAAVEKSYEGFFAWAWQWVQALWAEQGACLDPDGKCTSAAAPTVHTDAGACMDPNGSPCAASPHS